MSSEPTPAQQNVLDQIREWARLHGCTPTHAELAGTCGYSSTNAVRSHLLLLEKKGLIALEPGKARSIKLLDTAHARRRGKATSAAVIPLIGTIPAGPLTEAVQSSKEALAISPSLFQGSHLFALRVQGDSMRNDGIFSGDLAIIDQQNEVTDGAIAAVSVDGEATLKRVLRKGGSVVLRAANPAFPDTVIKLDSGLSVEIIGKLVGIVRTEVR